MTMLCPINRELELLLGKFEGNFYDLLINIERINTKRNHNLDSWTYKRNYPHKKASLSISLDNKGQCTFLLKTQQKTYSFGNGRSPKELMDDGEKLKAALKENHLYLTPEYTPEFLDALFSADIGSYIVLNTRKMISCVRKEGNKIWLKDCFDGNINHMTVNSFKNSNEYFVDKNDYDSIQSLFCKAYDTKSLTAPIRVGIQSGEGLSEVFKRENSIKENEAVIYRIGNIKLKLCDVNKKKIWFDTDNRQIDRKLVGNLFG